MCVLTVATAGGSGNGGPQPNPVTVVPGTAPVNPNLSGLAAASGVPTSAGASIAIVSNIPAGTATVAVALPSGILDGLGLADRNRNKLDQQLWACRYSTIDCDSGKQFRIFFPRPGKC